MRGEGAALGWERSFPGYPLTDEPLTPDGAGSFNHFQGGSIDYAKATGRAHEVHGAIRSKWEKLGWEKGLGLPLTDETRTADGRGTYNHFERGSIYWRPDAPDAFA